MPPRKGPKKKDDDSTTSSSGRDKKKSAKKEDSKKCFEETIKGKLFKFHTPNAVCCFDNFQRGIIKSDGMRRLGGQIITEKLKDFDVYEIDPINFDRRITSMQFHPRDPRLIGLGSKSGTLAIRFLDAEFNPKTFVQWDGIGPGGSITSIAFDPFTRDSVLTSSIDGTVKISCFTDLSRKTLLDTESFSTWYCSVNVSHETGLIIAGDTSGVLKLLSNKDLKVISQHRLHKKKINTAEFCKSRDWLLATASLDNTVKLWDIRKLEEKSPLNVLDHEHPVNSAYFSYTNGNRLLTTDQHSELRVYGGPLFSLETIIAHPHRHFQHLTPIKAAWHPLCDLAVVGRYPDPNWPTYETETRTVDIICAETGKMAVQLKSVSCEGIISLNVFNASGEILASGMGMFVPYWRMKPPFESKYPDIDVKDNPTNKDSKDEPPKPKRPPKQKRNDSKLNEKKKKLV